MDDSDSTPWPDRSTLIVPLGNERFLAKAHLRGADAIMLDLEDGVAPGAKAAARERLSEAVRSAGRGGARIKVRLNRPLGLLVRDLEAAVVPGVHVLGIAKVESAGHVRLVSEYVGALERERGLPPGGIHLAASLETPAALQQAHEIASADPRLRSIGLGSLDFAAACGFDPSPEALMLPKQLVLFAARAAGIRCDGHIGSVADYTDLDGLRAVVRRSRKLGFRGGSAIHPAQIPVLNEEFAPSAEELADARAVVDAAEAAFAAGVGAFAHRGRMVDKPMVDAARALLALGAAIAARDRAARELRAVSFSSVHGSSDGQPPGAAAERHTHLVVQPPKEMS